MAWNDGLQPGTPAYNIAASNHTRMRILAGPGAGKSFAMKRRVARILEEEGVAPANVLAVTFTRVAAEDLHRELVSLNVEGAGLLNGKTLHSLAISILKRNHVFAVLGRVARPLNKFELDPLLADLSSTYGTKHQRKKLMNAYGAAWARLQTEQPGFARTAQEQAFVDELVSWLKFHHAMLMDEIIPHLYQYLHTNPGAQERGEFQHILVDEYQDLNRAEQEIIQYLGEQGAMCIIGDDDQSIYSFRHAHPEGIRDWVNLQATDDHIFSECRRCPVTVVRMANSLIAHNVNRIVGRAMTERAENGQGQVVIRQYSTAEREANAVVQKISELIIAGVHPREIVVLTQRETFALPIFHGLRNQGIPTKSYYAESALDTIVAQERFATFKLLLNNDDRVALRWLLGRGHATWHSSPYHRLMEYCSNSERSPWETLTDLAQGNLVLPHMNSLIRRFQEIQAELTILDAAVDINQFVGLWLPDDPVTTLLSESVEVCMVGSLTPQDLYESLYEAITQPEIPMEVAEVRVMSLHKSKGLSSPYVFIVGCVEGLLPGRPDPALPQAEKEAKLEEDRRLFYVGITRVKADLDNNREGFLSLTYPQTMSAAAAYASQITPVNVAQGVAHLQASRFIAEMAPHAPASQFNIPL